MLNTFHKFFHYSGFVFLMLMMTIMMVKANGVKMEKWVWNVGIFSDGFGNAWIPVGDLHSRLTCGGEGVQPAGQQDSGAGVWGVRWVGGLAREDTLPGRRAARTALRAAFDTNGDGKLTNTDTWGADAARW